MFYLYIMKKIVFDGEWETTCFCEWNPPHYLYPFQQGQGKRHPPPHMHNHEARSAGSRPLLFARAANPSITIHAVVQYTHVKTIKEERKINWIDRNIDERR